MIVTADFGHGNELFAVDTGAIGSILSVGFYEEGNFNPESMQLTSLEISGGGGSLFTPAYELKDISASVDGSCVNLLSTMLLPEKSNSVDEFYRNIGQNLLQLFQSYTFDFEQMQFRVNGGATGSCAPAADED